MLARWLALAILMLAMLSQSSYTQPLGGIGKLGDAKKFHDFLAREFAIETESNDASVAAAIVDQFFWRIEERLLLEVGSISDAVSSTSILLSHKLLPLGWNRVLAEGTPVFMQTVNRQGRAICTASGRNNTVPLDSTTSADYSMPCIQTSDPPSCRPVLCRTLEISDQTLHVSVLAIDTARQEIAVLQSINWTFISADVVVVKSEDAASLHGVYISFFEKKGYLFLFNRGQYCWFKHSAFRPRRNELYQSLSIFLGNRQPSQLLEQKCNQSTHEVFMNFSRDNAPDYDADQDGEPLDIIELYFWEVCGGLVLDVGALDGQMYSQSAALVPLGWRRILIEGSPYLGPRLVPNNPEAISFVGYKISLISFNSFNQFT